MRTNGKGGLLTHRAGTPPTCWTCPLLLLRGLSLTPRQVVWTPTTTLPQSAAGGTLTASSSSSSGGGASRQVAVMAAGGTRTGQVATGGDQVRARKKRWEEG